MMPDKPNPEEEYVAFGIRWTPGGLKAVLWAAVMAAGVGGVTFWDKIAQVLSMAPVAAFIACIAYFTLVTPVYAGQWSPEAACFSVERDYVMAREVFPE